MRRIARIVAAVAVVLSISGSLAGVAYLQIRVNRLETQLNEAKRTQRSQFAALLALSGAECSVYGNDDQLAARIQSVEGRLAEAGIPEDVFAPPLFLNVPDRCK